METQKYYKIIRANSESPLYYDMLGRSIGEVCKMINERENTYTLRTSYLHDLFVPKSWAKECDKDGNELNKKRYFIPKRTTSSVKGVNSLIGKVCELVEDSVMDSTIDLKLGDEQWWFAKDECVEVDKDGNELTAKNKSYYKVLRTEENWYAYNSSLDSFIGKVCEYVSSYDNTTIELRKINDKDNKSKIFPASWCVPCDKDGNELTAKRYFVVLDGYAGYYNNHLSLSKPCELVEEDGGDVVIKVKGEDMVFSRDMCRECDINGNFLYEYDEDLGREVIPTEEDEWMNTPLGSYAPTPTEYDYDAIANHLKTDMEYDRRTDDSYIRRFPSGAVRGDNRGRPKPHWVSPYAVEEISMVLVENSNDFGALNYLNGICEDACLESLCRHVEEAKEALLVKNDLDEFRKVMRSVGFNAVAALHTIVLKEKGLYTKIYEQTEYIKK